MNLSGQEYKKIQIALIDAFPNTASLEQMLAFGLNRNLRAVTGEGSLQDIVFQLVQTANSQGWIEDLIDAAHKLNPRNLRLKAIAQEYLPNSKCSLIELAHKMCHWFTTLGYGFEQYEVQEQDYFEWIINIPSNIPGRRYRYERIFIRGVGANAGLSDVFALRSCVDRFKTDQGWLIASRQITPAARDEVENEENSRLSCYTLDEIIEECVDFSRYLDWLEEEVKRLSINTKYVHLACTKEEFDPDTKNKMGVSRYDERHGWIDGYMDRWLEDPAKEHISVLGEFGTGKTWFALHYAWVTLQRYRDAKKIGVKRPRLPLVITLRDYAKAVSVESLFSEFFFRKHEIPILKYSVFEQLNRMGKLLLIFDGFDEMAYSFHLLHCNLSIPKIKIRP
jgi:predicted NACHT family NTPase